MEQIINHVEKINNKPNSRIAVIDAFDKTNWKPITFGEVCRNINVTDKDPLLNGIEQYVGLEHIEPISMHLKSWGNVSDGTTFTKRFSAGHVLFGKRRAYLRKAAVADFDGVCSGDILVFEANEDLITPDLFPFLVRSDRFFDFAIQTSAGSLSPRTKFQDLANFEFLLPPKEQQAKLAELLWAADEVIEKYKELEIVFKKTLSVFINSRLSYNKHLGNSIPTDIGFIPDDWNLLQLKECLVSKPQYGANAPSIEYYSSLPRYIRITDINDDGDLIDEELVSIGSDNFDDYMLRHNDFLFARTGNTVGKTFLYKKEHGNAVFAGYLIKVRLNERILLPEFLDLFCRSDKYTSFIRKSVKVGAQPNVNAEQYSNMWLPVPSIDVQKLIVESYTAIKEKLKLLHQQTLPSQQKVQKTLINQIFS